ncbi:YfjI family protein [Xanthobacter autotrophicus]|uniref:YfjI family protein n=1 Tax=Xanthobacter autotrophicus TaxID=280 RepID=UPI003729434F
MNVISLEEAEARQAAGPLPLYPHRPQSKAYPVDALGAVLARGAGAIARKVGVPDALAAQAVLSSAALAAQAHADVQLPFGQCRPLSLYHITVAGSGDRKSSADNEALWPFRKRERALREAYESALEDWGAANAAWHAKRKRLEADRQVEDLKGALLDLGAEPAKPLLPMLIFSDATLEGILKAWPLAPASLGLFASEGGTFSGGAGMNAENRLKTSAGLSELWDNRPSKRLRSGDGVMIHERRRLSLHLMMQPDVAREFFGDGVLRDQGLLSRVLIAAPDSIAGTRLYRDPTPEDEAAIHAYGARILSILEAPWPLAEGTRNELEPRALTMDPGAKASWIAFFNSVEEGSARGEIYEDIRDFASKAAEHAARIAGVLTIVEDLNAPGIGKVNMDAAITLMDWYLQETLRLTTGAKADTRLMRANDLLKWMRDRGSPVVGFREILQSGPGHCRTKAAADELVAVLVDHQWIAEEGGRARRFRLSSPSR